LNDPALGANRFQVHGNTIVEIDPKLTRIRHRDPAALTTGARFNIVGAVSGGILVAREITFP